VKKGNPFEEGGGEDEQEKGQGRTRTYLKKRQYVKKGMVLSMP
jgi:hypothetical protein